MNIWDLLENYGCSADALTSGDYMTCSDCSEVYDCSNCPIFEETKEYFEDIINE